MAGEDLREAIEAAAAEERELVFGSFTNEEALELGLALVERARGRGKSVTVDVERSGQVLFHHAMTGTTPDNRTWIERKKRAVGRWHRSSWALGLGNRARGRSLADALGPTAADYADHGGCFPVVVRGVGFVGTVTVSGLPQQEDHELVVEVIRAFLAAPGRRLSAAGEAR